MSPLHLLLRIALCVTLALNGSGLAVAATQMHMHHATVAAGTAATQDGHATCGEHQTADASHAVTMASGCPSSAMDCCEGAACSAACAAGFLATLATPPPVWQPTPHIPSSRLVMPNPPAPLLHDRYRPPIR